jgi:hypothetical protein
MSVDAPAEPAMGKHRRPDDDVPLGVERFEQLMILLHLHRPLRRSGLCLQCGEGWPCLKVRVTTSGSNWW